MHIVGALFTIILGTLTHFLYEWSGKKVLVGLFSAVNESTFEHLKLIIIPFTVFAVIEYFVYGKDKNNFFTSKLVSLIAGAILIIILFYTYSGIVGKNYLVADIATFIISVIVSYYLSYRFISDKNFNSKDSNFYGLTGFFVLLFLVIIFTFNPPDIALFKDPVTGISGI